MCSTVGKDLPMWTEIPSYGAAGGMLLAWDPSVVSKDEELVGSFSISVRFTDLTSGFNWTFTGVSGPSLPNNRNLFRRAF